MKEARNIALVSSLDGDWHGLYVDGQLAAQSHSLRPRDILKALGIEFRDLIAQQEWMEKEGSLPPTLGEVIIDLSMGECDDE